MLAAVGGVASAAELLPMVDWYVWVGTIAVTLVPMAAWAHYKGRGHHLSGDWLNGQDDDCVLEIPASDNMLAAAWKYARSVYGRDALSLERLKIWREANPWTIAVMRCPKNHYQGHFDLLPLTREAAERLIRGTLAEHSLDEQHIMSEELMHTAEFLYIAGVCVRDHDGGDGDLRAAQLIGGLASMAKELYGSKKREVFAIATTDDGIRLLENPNLNHRKLREPAARPDGHPVYGLELTPQLLDTILSRVRRRAAPATLSSKPLTRNATANPESLSGS
jgi:hypothetical protein